MRAVLDTNILVAALFWRGTPHRLLEHVRNGTLTLIGSPTLLAELTDVVGRTKFDDILIRTGTSRARSLEELRRITEMINAPPLPQPVCRDPDDDAVLACAIAGEADCIVSGDQDLLVLGSYQGIPIVTPSQALQLINAAQQ